MKKLLILSSILMCLTVSAQTGTTTDARNYVNANITTNGANSITGAKMNTALNKIINAIDTGQWRLQSGYLQPKDTTKQIRIPQLKSAAPACVGDYVGLGNSVAYLDVASLIMDDGSFCDASIMQNVNRLLAIDDIFFTPDTTIVCSPPAPYEVSVVFTLPSICAGAYIEGIELRTKGTFNSVSESQIGTSLMVDNVPIYYNGQPIWADAQDNGSLDYTILDNTHRTSISSVVGTFFWVPGTDFSLDGLQITYHIRSDLGPVVLTTDASGILKFDTINIPTSTSSDIDSLINLKDIQITSPNDGQILIYNNGKWGNSSGSTNNIYTNDGVLQSNRVINANSKQLHITDLSGDDLLNPAFLLTAHNYTAQTDAIQFIGYTASLASGISMAGNNLSAYGSLVLATPNNSGVDIVGSSPGKDINIYPINQRLSIQNVPDEHIPTKVFTQNSNGFVSLSDVQDIGHYNIYLGSVTYDSINNAPADVSIGIDLTNLVPVDMYPTSIIIELVTPFSENTPVFTNVFVQAGGSPTVMFGEIFDIYSGVKFIHTLDLSGAIAKQTIQQPSKFIVSFDSGNSEVNPKDFTAGEVKIWAVCQKFPF